MDESLRILPTHRIGHDGFNWWVGQVEQIASEEPNNKGGYRCRVRIVGDHPKSKKLLDTSLLPWAQIMMPCNVPFMPGNVGGGSHGLIKGCWVVGFYLDEHKQKPIVMGSIGQTPGATTKVNEEEPDDTDGLKRVSNPLNRPVNPYTDGSNEPGGTTKDGGGLDDGTKGGDGKPRVNPPARRYKGIEDEEWCQDVAEKCDKQDLNQRFTTLLSEFLYEIQRNGGNVGTYLVNEVNGEINDAIGEARKYVDKGILIVNKFIAEVKGYIIGKMTAGVKDLIQSLIYPNKKGNILTPVTEWFNNLLKDLNCSMEDLGERLEKFLTDLLMKIVQEIYKNVVCHVDSIVSQIIGEIERLIEDVLNSVLGPLQDILGAIAAPLNMIGGAIDQVMELLGITCSGPDQTCSKYKSICTDGEEEENKDDEEDFLDKLLDGIDDLFGDSTKPDYTKYTCPEAYEGNTLSVTTVGFTGGVPDTPSDTFIDENGEVQKIYKNQIVYSIDDITITEGDVGKFTITRKGNTSIASSLKYSTLIEKGTAEVDSDFLELKGIVGFAANATKATIDVTTLLSDEIEEEEYFYVKLAINSPKAGSQYISTFEKNIGKCTIIEVDQTEPYNQYTKINVPLEKKLGDTFPESVTTIPVPDNAVDSNNDGIPDINDLPTVPTYNITTDKSIVKEGEFIVYTITTENVSAGTILYYTLFGSDITPDDILGGSLTGSFTIDNEGKAKVTIGIQDDGVVEEEETLSFTINNTGASVDVLIQQNDESLFFSGGDGVDDFGINDEGVGENSKEIVILEPKPPTVDPEKIITDENGSIIEIPIDDPGDPWAEPPYVFIGGEGIGAKATALLDPNGFITEIRIKAGGYGYKKNLAEDNNVRCIIDTFTLIRPGIGYKEPPNIYINGILGLAEVVINDNGFVIGARMLDRETSYTKFPRIDIVGGGGYGAKLLPSLVCLDTEALTTIGSTKIGTGRYVDCP